MMASDIVMNVIIDQNYVIIAFLKYMNLNNSSMLINTYIAWNVIKIGFALGAMEECLVIGISQWDIVTNAKKRDVNSVKIN